MSDINYGALVGATDPVREGSGPLVGSWLLFRAGLRADVIFTNEGKRTPAGLILLSALLFISRQRKLVLSEFLPGVRLGVKGAFVTIAYRTLLPRVVLKAQVMTVWEREDYAVRYRLKKRILEVIPFYFYDDRLVDEPMDWNPEGRAGYLSTGKNASDWETLLRAAHGRDWPLTMISKRAEYEVFGEMALRAGVTAMHDVPRRQHDDMLATAELLIVSLREKSVSSGHVRLMSAVTFGTPAILSSVKGVRGYEHLAVALVPPGDPLALRETVERVMTSPGLVRSRMTQIREVAMTRPYSLYAEEVRELVLEASRSRG